MQSGKRIAVTGATGRVGRHVVDVLREQGHDAVAMSRATGVDVITGEGLDAAMEGVDAIIDTATDPSGDQAAATEFFLTSARNVQAAAARAGVERLVVVSIIGTDQFTTGYNAAKHAHEQAVLAGPLPVRVLRAAQFHEFVAQLVDWGRQGDVSYLPEMRTQLVAARTVAEALVALAVAPAWDPSDATITEIAGPREESLVAVAGLLAAERGDPARVEGVPQDEQFASGALLPGPDATLAGPTFAAWLDSTVRAGIA